MLNSTIADVSVDDSSVGRPLNDPPARRGFPNAGLVTRGEPV
jgi:hypothetical protein